MPCSLPARTVWAGALPAAALLVLGGLTPPARPETPGLGGLTPPARQVDDEYADRIRPLVAKYCGECHSGEQPEADLDLTKFKTLADIRKATRAWQKVGEMLDGGQMPPKDAAQPTDAERAALRGWVRAHLKAEAKAHAGDPGRVTLRRLSNAEYTYTVRDLTGLPSLDPAKEFPVDGAAGEGFTNTGDALAMSPALLGKYLDAAKRIAAHAVLLPDGLAFSPSTTRQDWTNERLDAIRELYRKYTDPSGGTKVALQGLVWDGKEGGRLPVEKYVEATLAERDAIRSGRTTVAAVAAGRGLSPKYLAAVWAMFTGTEPAPLLDDLRAKWRAAGPGDAAAVTAEITRWQNAVWKFSPVGHIGKVNGPKAWLEPVNPLVSRQEVRWKARAEGTGDITLYLAASDCGDGNDADYVVWDRPRFVAPGRPDLLLKDVRAVAAARAAHRARVLADTAKYLAAADAARAADGKADAAELAKARGLDADALRGWLDVLGIGTGGAVKVTGHLADKLLNGGNYPFVKGWGTDNTPLVVANSSDQFVRIPGDLKGRGVAVHPSPTLAVVVGWQSPVTGRVRVVPKVLHAHPACGNGVTWAVEVRRGTTRERLAAGVAQGQTPPKIEPLDLPVSAGDVVAAVVGPRDGNHSCDLTAVDLTISSGDKTWDVAKDVTADVHAGNPHADGHGNAGVWHFVTEPAAGGAGPGAIVPKGSVLDRWRAAGTPAEREALAAEVQRLLTAPAPADAKSPDGLLHRRLSALGGPLFGRSANLPTAPAGDDARWGIDPAIFGRHPAGGGAVDPASLCVKAPWLVEVTVPADLIAGTEFVSGGVIHPDARDQATAQLRVTTARPAGGQGLQPDAPVLVADGPARTRMAAGLDAFRALFPTAACYARIVPVDEVVTLTLYHREDGHLARLLLSDDEARRLDRLWDELHYVGRDALAQVDVLEQLIQYATQDADPTLFTPLRKPTKERADAFRRRLVETEPQHLDAVLRFADRAYRRPLTAAEKDELTALYRRLRGQELPHEEAIKLTLARVLVAPAFLYKLETPGPTATAAPVSDHELANRLSYFLWSSAPDEELRAAAAAGRLRDPDVLAAQMRRMLTDDRVRRLATEFGCQWLHVRGFDAMNEKSERHFPSFAGLRGAMYEESVLFFTDFFRGDRSVGSLLDADATFLNESLARHYGIPGVTGEQWRRVEGVRKHGRGGILGLATTLATQSGASRTSPVLRGNWVSEVLLGEKLPRPPKGVPQLPDDEAATAGLTVRQLVEKHASDAKCAVCHKRIDPYGFALEAYDPIGRKRDADLGGRPVDTRAKAPDGTAFDGLDGLRDYLVTKRKDAFERQFCRKLVGYALGRSVQLSDEPLLDDMQAALAKNGGRISAALEAVVRSKPFREIRGSRYPAEE